MPQYEVKLKKKKKMAKQNENLLTKIAMCDKLNLLQNNMVHKLQNCICNCTKITADQQNGKKDYYFIYLSYVCSFSD